MFVTRFIKMAQEQPDGCGALKIRLHAKTAESHKPGGSKIIIMFQPGYIRYKNNMERRSNQ